MLYKLQSSPILTLALLLVWAAVHSAPLAAQVVEEQQSSETSPPPQRPAELSVIPEPQGIQTPEVEEVAFHKNHFGVFVGGTTQKERSGFTLGADYERRFHRFIGIGVQAEHAWGSVKDTAVVFPVYFHPGGGLRLAAGPGFSSETETEEPGEGEGGSDATEKTVTDFLWRVQLLYDFELKERVTLTPNLAIDFVSGRQFFVYGVTLGYLF